MIRAVRGKRSLSLPQRRGVSQRRLNPGQGCTGHSTAPFPGKISLLFPNGGFACPEFQAPPLPPLSKLKTSKLPELSSNSHGTDSPGSQIQNEEWFGPNRIRKYQENEPNPFVCITYKIFSCIHILHFRDEDHRIREYPEWEETHRDHPVQLLPCTEPPRDSIPCGESRESDPHCF